MSDKTLKTKSKAFVRNVQRPIAEKVESNVQYHVEVKSVSIRNVNIPVSKLKDRSNMQYIPLMEQMSEKNQDVEQRSI
jgi:broad specificity polyphosphatase/5'/3'-nucleotidase SurE